MCLLTIAATERRTRRDFHRLPASVYSDDPHWLPPIAREVARTLDPVRNPYFRHAGLELFVTYRDNRPVARAALVTDRRRLDTEGLAQFGYFESRNDPTGVAHLFQTLAGRARAAGACRLEGPMSPNHYGEVGLQVDRFDRAPAFFQPHHPPYLATCLREAGLTESVRLHTRRNPDVARTIRDRFAHRRLRTKARGLVARPFDPHRRTRDLERMRVVYEDAFAANWRFLPVSADEYLFAAKHLAVVTRPRHITIVESHGEPVGVLQCALDVNPALRVLGGRVTPLRWWRFLRTRARTRDLVVVAVAVRPAWRGTSAFSLLFDALCRLARETRVLETTWVHPENTVVQQVASRLDLEEDRGYAMYEADLDVANAI